MTKVELAKRIAVFLFSVMIQGCGISILAHALVGITPIASFSYVISLHCPLSLGGVTFFFHLALMVLQYFLLFPNERDRRHIMDILWQIPMTFWFSLAIDTSGWLLDQLLTGFDLPYAISIGMVILGSLIIATGITLAVHANVALVTGEAVVKLISQRIKKEFGFVKMGFDLTLVSLASIISFIATNFTMVEGVREGTLLSACMVGPTVRFLMPRLRGINRFFYPKERRVAYRQAQAQESQQFHGVITIAREYGCGGRILGQKLADKLKIGFYDNELIGMIAKEAGLSTDVVADKVGRLDNALLYEMIFKDYTASLDQSLSTQDALFVASSRVIRSLAHKENCVIVGRGADFILGDNPRCLNVYLYSSSLQYKLDFCQANYHEDEATAQEKMARIDHQRNEYHRHYNGHSLANARNYDLCLDVSALGPEACCDLIASAYKKLQNSPKAHAHKLDHAVHDALLATEPTSKPAPELGSEPAPEAASVPASEQVSEQTAESSAAPNEISEVTVTSTATATDTATEAKNQ